MAEQDQAQQAAKPAKAPRAPKPPKPSQKPKDKSQSTPAIRNKKPGDASKDIIGITVSKEENFSQWYQEIVIKAEMVEYYNEISGFYILRPAAMHVWNEIRRFFQERIEELGVEETSFPMFLSSKSLEKEKEHVEGFAPELAWVRSPHLYSLQDCFG